MLFDDPMGKKAGTPVKSASEVAASFLGLNIYHPSLLTFQSNVEGFKREMNEIKAERSAAVKDPDLTQADIKKINDKYSKLLIEKQRELAEFVRKSQVSPEIVKLIADSVEGRTRKQ